jgi:hypothetical protein
LALIAVTAVIPWEWSFIDDGALLSLVRRRGFTGSIVDFYHLDVAWGLRPSPDLSFVTSPFEGSSGGSLRSPHPTQSGRVVHHVNGRNQLRSIFVTPRSMG